MSWQTYVDEHLMCEIDGQILTAAAIVGHDGSVWAQSENFPQLRLSSELRWSPKVYPNKLFDGSSYVSAEEAGGSLVQQTYYSNIEDGVLHKHDFMKV